MLDNQSSLEFNFLELKINLISTLNALEETLQLINTGSNIHCTRECIYTHIKLTNLKQSFFNCKTLTLPRAFEEYFSLNIGETKNYPIYIENKIIYGDISYISRSYDSSNKPYLQLRLKQLPENINIGDKYLLKLYKNKEQIELVFEKV